MRSRALRWLMLFWAVFWLVVYVPGHQRGRVLIPGGESYVEGGGCCASDKPDGATTPTLSEAPASCHTDASATSNSAPPASATPPVPVDRANHCAVCFVSANTESAPTIDFHPPTVTLLGELCPPPLESLHSQASLDRTKARDPPTTHAV